MSSRTKALRSGSNSEADRSLGNAPWSISRSDCGGDARFGCVGREAALAPFDATAGRNEPCRRNVCDWLSWGRSGCLTRALAPKARKESCEPDAQRRAAPRQPTKSTRQGPLRRASVPARLKGRTCPRKSVAHAATVVGLAVDFGPWGEYTTCLTRGLSGSG